LINSPRFKKYLPYLSLGTEIAVVFSVPILIGYWIDRKYEVYPWGILAGIFLGVILMINIFVKVIRDTSKN